MLDHVAVVGAKGGMGRLFVRRFEQAGVRVLHLDRPLDPDRFAAPLARCGLVLLCVPISAMASVSALLAPHTPPTTILADIASVKAEPLRHMLAASSGPVVGTHPLFGPAPRDDDPLTTALCPGRDDAALCAVRDLFERIGLRTFLSTAEEHDRAMAYIQGLNFITTISYLSAMPADVPMHKFLTPSFRRRLASASKMITQDADLFAQLFDHNPFSADAVRGFRAHLNIAAGGDLDLLKERALWWWKDIEADAAPPEESET